MAMTIAQIEQALTTAAGNHDMAAITSTINAITSAQKSMVNPAIYDLVVRSIAEFTFWNDADSESTMRNFITKVGQYVSGGAIARSMQDYAFDGNYGGLDAVTDRLTSLQKANLNNNGILDIVLRSVAEDTFNSGNDSLVNTALRDLITKVGTYINADAIAHSMSDLAFDANYEGLDAVTDRLTSIQKANLNNNGDVDNVLRAVAEDTFNSGNDSLINAALRDLMAKVGNTINADAIARSMGNLAFDDNYEGLDAVTDYLTSIQKINLNNNGDVDNVLRGLAEDTFNSGNDTIINAALRDLMAKIGTYINADAIVRSMGDLTFDDNYAGLDAVTDYLTATQKANLNNSGDLDNVLRGLAEDTFNSGNDTIINAVLRDIMAKVGTYVSGNAIARSMGDLAFDSNYAGLDAVTDYLTATQKANLNNNGDLDNVLRAVAEDTFNSGNDSIVNAALRDLMVKVGSYASGSAVNSMLQDLSFDHNAFGIDAVLENITPVQLANVTLSNLTGQGYTVGTSAADVINGKTGSTASNDIIFSLGGNDTVHGRDGHDAIFGEAGNDVLYGDAGNDWLIGGIGRDTLTGGTGADMFVINNTKQVDTITDFHASEGDHIVFMDVLTGYSSIQDVINNFVHARNDGANTIISVDADGAANGVKFVDVANLLNVTNLDVASLFQESTTV